MHAAAINADTRRGLEESPELSDAELPGGGRGSVYSCGGAVDGAAPTIFESPEDRQLILNVFLHCADISNPVKPRHISGKWVAHHWI
jgi:3'5'-cyclic nucleotide phosphodiesterase